MKPESVRTSEQRLRAAVESAPSGLLMIDGEGRIVLVNREIERLFGYSREELLGRPVEQLIPERYRHSHPVFRAEFVADPQVRPMEAGRDLYGLRRDGSEVPVEIGLTPVATEEGHFVLSSIVDITARKRAEARFRVAVESSPNGVVMTDATGRIVLLNRAVERMFGYRREELFGRSIEVLVPERFRGSHPGFRTGFFASPRERPMGEGRDLFGLRKDGSEIPVEIGLNPIETEEGLFVLSSIVDISARRRAEADRHRLEERLRQAQKLEAVGTLAGGIAHDFRNILNAIIGYAELLREAIQGEQATSDLQELLQFTERGRQLVERILTFSRRQEPVRRPLDLRQAVAEAQKLLRATLPSSVRIEQELRDDAPMILADPTSVQQVLMNLGSNAAQAMPGGGTLRIVVEPFYARDSFARADPDLREGPYAILSVRDTGSGIEPAVLERVFEPFFTTRGPGEGTGLGLAVVHGIMREHEGAVRIESRAREGTLVRCYFPALLTPFEETAAPAADLPRGNGAHVLLVDDEPALVRIGERRLLALGYRVTTATDGPAALAIFRARPAAFDLVVTDFTMPDMNGLELARELSRMRPGVPIVLVTGYIGEFPIETMQDAGVTSLLLKPVTTAELARVGAAALKAAGG